MRHFAHRGPRLALALFLLVAATVGLADAEAVASSEPLSLSEALRQARACGPGFASAELMGEALHLERLAREAERGLKPSLSVSAQVFPAVRPSPKLIIQGERLGSLSVSAVSDPEQITVDYTRSLWPPDDPALRRTVEELEVVVQELEYEQAVASAYRAVVDAFTGLSNGRAEAELAEKALALARDRAAAAEARYATGQIGVREWQEARQALREAEVALQRAQSAVQQGQNRLARLLWGACASPMDGGAVAQRPLHDDVAWETFIDRVRAVLAQPGTVWQEQVLATHGEYQQALLQQRQQEAELKGLQRASRVSVNATLAAVVPIGSAAGSPSDFAASVAASIDLSGTSGIRVEQGAVNLAAAEARTEQARLEALDAVTAARIAVQDAQFALEVAEQGAQQAAADLAIVQRRFEAGLVGPLELAEAELAAVRTRAELAKAENELRLAWLDLGLLLGVQPPGRS